MTSTHGDDQDATTLQVEYDHQTEASYRTDRQTDRQHIFHVRNSENWKITEMSLDDVI